MSYFDIIDRIKYDKETPENYVPLSKIGDIE